MKNAVEADAKGHRPRELVLCRLRGQYATGRTDKTRTSRLRAENRNMAQIFCFPLHRREKLVRELRRARTDGEVRFALRRAALALERVGVPAAIIDAQIRQISLMTRRQMWRFQPAERPSGDAA